jgi:hypothetical protein
MVHTDMKREVEEGGRPRVDCVMIEFDIDIGVERAEVEGTTVVGEEQVVEAGMDAAAEVEAEQVVVIVKLSLNSASQRIVKNQTCLG